MCLFDLCEFYNLFFGGLFIGVISSFAFVGIQYLINKCKFNRTYKHLNSKNENFDWICYSKLDGSDQQSENLPNGAIANIKVKKGKIIITERYDDNEWVGELNVQGNNFGILSYKYKKKHLYGRRDCVIGNYIKDNSVFDFIFCKQLNNTIVHIEKGEDGKLIPTYNYGEEVLIRERIIS